MEIGHTQIGSERAHTISPANWNILGILNFFLRLLLVPYYWCQNFSPISSASILERPEASIWRGSTSCSETRANKKTPKKMHRYVEWSCHPDKSSTSESKTKNTYKILIRESIRLMSEAMGNRRKKKNKSPIWTNFNRFLSSRRLFWVNIDIILCIFTWRSLRQSFLSNLLFVHREIYLLCAVILP